MTDTKTDTAPTYSLPRPTAARPLLGLTVLAVEDSRFASDALRLLCLKSGARLRRADCLRAAERHLRVYRPSVVIVDLGLPDGSGADLIADLNRATPRVAALFGTSGDGFAETVALAAGADGFLTKPAPGLAGFQKLILSHLPPELHPLGPRSFDDLPVQPDPIAYRDDIAHAADLLNSDPDDETFDYLLRFLSSVALSAGDAALSSTLRAMLPDGAQQDRASGPTRHDLSAMLRARSENRMAI